MRRLLVIVLPMLLGACSTLTEPLHGHRAVPVPGHAAADPRFAFRGTWEGTLAGYDAPGYVDGAGFTMRFRFVMTGRRVRVYNLVEGAWREMKPGRFRMRQLGPQAVIQSSTSGQDEDGTWVESSSFTLAHLSPEAIVVYWQRTVNNLDLQPTDQWYQFAWGYSGTIHRVPGG